MCNGDLNDEEMEQENDEGDTGRGLSDSDRRSRGRGRRRGGTNRGRVGPRGGASPGRGRKRNVHVAGGSQDPAEPKTLKTSSPRGSRGKSRPPGGEKCTGAGDAPTINTTDKYFYGPASDEYREKSVVARSYKYDITPNHPVSDTLTIRKKNPNYRGPDKDEDEDEDDPKDEKTAKTAVTVSDHAPVESLVRFSVGGGDKECMNLMTFNANHFSSNAEYANFELKLAMLKHLLGRAGLCGLTVQEINLLRREVLEKLAKESGLKFDLGPLMKAGDRRNAERASTQYEYYPFFYDEDRLEVLETFTVFTRAVGIVDRTRIEEKKKKKKDERADELKNLELKCKKYDNIPHDQLGQRQKKWIAERDALKKELDREGALQAVKDELENLFAETNALKPSPDAENQKEDENFKSVANGRSDKNKKAELRKIGCHFPVRCGDVQETANVTLNCVVYEAGGDIPTTTLANGTTNLARGSADCSKSKRKQQEDHDPCIHWGRDRPLIVRKVRDKKSGVTFYHATIHTSPSSKKQCYEYILYLEWLSRREKILIIAQGDWYMQTDKTELEVWGVNPLWGDFLASLGWGHAYDRRQVTNNPGSGEGMEADFTTWRNNDPDVRISSVSAQALPAPPSITIPGESVEKAPVTYRSQVPLESLDEDREASVYSDESRKPIALNNDNSVIRPQHAANDAVPRFQHNLDAATRKSDSPPPSKMTKYGDPEPKDHHREEKTRPKAGGGADGEQGEKSADHDDWGMDES